MRKPTSAKAAAPPTPSAQPRLELKDIGTFPPNLTHRTMYVYVAQQPIEDIAYISSFAFPPTASDAH